MINSFKNKNFSIYFSGQSFSLLGSWVQQIALVWLVYDISQSAFLLGLVGFVSQIPILFIAPIAGVLSDKYNKKNILLATQIFAMIQALILAYFTWSNQIEIYHILILATTLGIITGLEIPTRQSIMVDFIKDKKDLSNAIALNSLLVNLARFVGPVIAGLVITYYDATICFLINALSYSAIIISLLLIKIDTSKQDSKVTNKISAYHSFKEGIVYINENTILKNVLFFLALSSFTIMPYIVLMPLVVEELYKSSATTMGILLAPAGIGAIFANLYLASCRDHTKLCKILIIGSLTSSSALVLFSISNVFWMSLVLMTLVGFGFILQVVSSNMIIQKFTDNSKRGRVMSLYTMAYMGTIPIGSIIAGAIASWIGATDTLLLLGLFSIFGSLIYRHRIRCKQPVVMANLVVS